MPQPPKKLLAGTLARLQAQRKRSAAWREKHPSYHEAYNEAYREYQPGTKMPTPHAQV